MSRKGRKKTRNEAHSRQKPEQGRAAVGQGQAALSADRQAELLRAAMGHINGNELQEAEQLCREVLAANAQHGGGWHLLGLVLQKRGAGQEAVDAFQRAVELEPGNYIYHYNFGNLCEALGRRDMAFDCYRKALKLNPGNLQTLLNIGVLHERQGELDEAAATYHKVLSAEPENFVALFNLANVTFKQQQPQEAAAFYKKALSVKPDFEPALENLAEACGAIGDGDTIRSCYRKLHQLAPGRWDIRIKLKIFEMPGPWYYTHLRQLQHKLRPETYLEIGVAEGKALALAQPPTRAIGIDPEPKIKHAFQAETKIFPVASDEFFDSQDVRAAFGGRPIELAFLDGLHLFEQILKDFINTERFMAPGGVILLHDTLPPDALCGARERSQVYWAGDVWKVIPCLKKYRPDLRICTVASPPTGLTIIANLDPHSTVLAENYEAAVEEFIGADFAAFERDQAQTLGLIPNSFEAVDAFLANNAPQPDASPPPRVTPAADGVEKLFVIGPYKTATSTLVGMLNCHPEIFLLYETNLMGGGVSKYGHQFLERYPDGRHLFRYSDEFGALYDDLARFLAERGHRYRIVGDKLPFFDALSFPGIVDHGLIFCVRDIRTWLAKGTVVQIFHSEADIVPIAVDYTCYFLQSFLAGKVFHCPMEELISDNDGMIDRLGAFLGMDLRPHLDQWWDKIVVTDGNDPKSALQWWQSHSSSLEEPHRTDSSVILQEHPFWDGLLPIFDKYYHGVGRRFSRAEVESDIDTVKSLRRFSPLPLRSAFHEIQWQGADGSEKFVYHHGRWQRL